MLFKSTLFLFSVPLLGQTPIPDWCRAQPRPEYKTLERVPISDSWFEVYKVVPGVFAIYEPHQAEETIGYLIVGGKRALLFDTGMGISDVKKVVSELTKLPIVVLNSHTHDDHVGGNWQFSTIYGMDTDFTRRMREVPAPTHRLKSLPTRSVARSRRDLTRRPMQRGHGRSRLTRMTVTASIWAAELWT
jgi:glyoxylase-like metal-dependent hydrolase (beta-lactamase superfamily II)